MSGILIRSPFTRQRSFESSRTVFMFSIHSASTGPSKHTQCRSELFALCRTSSADDVGEDPVLPLSA